ncbi:MAG: glycine zipper 2TM domain-containing protein [Betaproteobacteria bacterium]
MNKFAIAILLSAGVFVSVQAQAADRAIIGAVDGALVGSYYGGAHGAVAGAIIGAAIGSSTERYDDRRVVTYSGRNYGYASYAPDYYAQPSYDNYYEPRYEPQQVVYVQSPVYERYPVIYSGYRAPVYGGYYGGQYSSPYRSQYVSHQGHRDRRSYDHRGRY